MIIVNAASTKIKFGTKSEREAKSYEGLYNHRIVIINTTKIQGKIKQIKTSFKMKML